MHASLSEILLILLVALLVIKPEKLPDAAFTLGRWLKWFRQTIIKIKQEVEEPLKQLSSEQVDNERK
ncbi:MAG: hypothetical protein ACD_44C00475G0005 [uncultured bacterium]|nr:MAG: hypothetical protein ACD_44C00475G0005 [uncultured bacterium]